MFSIYVSSQPFSLVWLFQSELVSSTGPLAGDSHMVTMKKTRALDSLASKESELQDNNKFTNDHAS